MKRAVSGFRKFMLLLNEPHADYEMVSGALTENYDTFSDEERQEVEELIQRLSRSKLEYERSFAKNLRKDLEGFLRGKKR